MQRPELCFPFRKKKDGEVYMYVLGADEDGVYVCVTKGLVVLFFQEPFNGIKGVALVVWSFTSYLYGKIGTHAKQSNKPPNADQSDP
jgi:hypothetical protein